MKVTGWVLLGGVGLLAAACGGKGVSNVGELNSSAGAGGSIAGAPDLGGAANGNSAGSPQQHPQNGEVFHEGLTDVRGIAANATTLYWVEYGSMDSLGNFQNDGRLLARDFDSEDVRVLADDLPGAVNVAVTATHAYVYVDQYFEAGGPRDALVRMTLSGADYALVQLDVTPQNAGDGVCLRCLVSVDGAAYFVDDDSIFRVSDEDPKPALFVERAALSMTVDETTLYLAEGTGAWQVPFATGIATKLSPQRHDSLQTFGAHLYGLEVDEESVFLARIPKGAAGGWERLAPRHDARYTWHLQLVDDLFFHDLHLQDERWQVVQGKLDETAGAQVVLELPAADPHRAWLGTAAGIFWNDATRIRRVPLGSE